MATRAPKYGSWQAPGPGTWELDVVHWPRPVTAHLAQVLPAIEQGFAEASESYGWLVARFNLRTVHRFVYTNYQTADGREFEIRFERCAEAFASRRWRSEIERWDQEAKPAALERHRALLDADPAALDDAALVDHLDACHTHHASMFAEHQRFNGTHMIPVGDFLAATSAWTHLPQERVAGLLAGAAPVSRGWGEETATLVRVIQAQPRALALLDGRRNEAAVLDELRSLGGELERALDDWLFVVGPRLIDGFDVTYPTGSERPAVLLASLRSALRVGNTVVSADDDLAKVRAAVPAKHRDEFDQRHEDARLCYRLRDERGIYCDAIAAGIARRGLLAAGRRLADRGALPSPDLALQATVQELAALLEQPDASLVEELTRRMLYQRSMTIEDAPPSLGEPPRPAGSLAGLPPAVARMTAALLAFRGAPAPHGAPEPSDDRGPRTLQGVGIGGGLYRGTARIVRSPDDFDKLAEGDVLVAITTGEAFNLAIALAGAVVTDQGSVMSHTAITAREYGIPAVVGASDATAKIPDGAIVAVNASDGTVRW